jgi:hypothetical protein
MHLTMRMINVNHGPRALPQPSLRLRCVSKVLMEFAKTFST